MKNQLSLLAVALLLAQPVLAKDIPLNRAAALANSATPYRPPAVRRWPMRKGLATSTSSATRWGRGWATRF